MVKTLSTIIFLLFATVSQSKELTFVVHTNSGGHLINSRLVAKHLPKYLKEKVVIKTMPGAGGVVQANYIYNIAPKDGSVVGNLHSRMSLVWLIGGKNVNFDYSKFTWLGSSEDGRKGPIILWSKTNSDEFIAGYEGKTKYSPLKFIQNISNIKMKKIYGYKTRAETRLAFEKNEINLIINSLAGVNTIAKHWLTSSEIKPLIQWGMGVKRHDNFKNTPTLMNFAKDEETKEMVKLFETQSMMSKPFVAPPNIPKERAKILQDAFAKVFTDPDYVQDSKKAGIEVSPIFAKEAEDISKIISANKSSKLLKYFSR